MSDITTRARALLAAATPGPWEADAWYNNDGGWAAIGPHHMATEDEGYDDVPESPAHHRAMADAALIAAAPELIAALCDALASAERRAKEAEAQAAAWRQHVAALVAAMKTWGSLEDGVPSADDVGEIGNIGRAFDAAHNALRVKLSETTALHGIAEARERLMERELLAIWATVRSGNPAPLTDRDVLHAVEDVRRERDALRAEMESAERRAEEAEAQAAEMRAAIDEARRCPMGAAASSILACALNVIPAGRAILDRLAAAEAERDAMRVEVKREAAMRAEMAAEIKRLRARRAARCSKCAACPGWLRDRTGLPNVKCHVCGGSGAVIVEGEK